MGFSPVPINHDSCPWSGRYSLNGGAGMEFNFCGSQTFPQGGMNKSGDDVESVTYLGFTGHGSRNENWLIPAPSEGLIFL